MEQQLLTPEEPPDTGWRGPHPTPPFPVKTKEKTDSSESQIRGSELLIPQLDALIILLNNSESVPLCSWWKKYVGGLF